MGPKRTASESAGGSAKRVKKVMTLTDKVKVLDELRAGKSYVAIGRMFSVNESNLRYIKKSEKVIRDAVMASTASSAKISHQVRDKAVVKMENALFIWLEDSHKKGVPVDSNVIREKARVLYNRFKGDAAEDAGEGPSSQTAEGATSTFAASKGWFERFKHRFSLRNVKMSGEAASADHTAAAAFPQTLKDLIEE